MPPTIDIEPSGSCRKMPPKAKFRKDLDAFIAKIEKAYGKMPILYVNGEMYKDYFEGDKLRYPIWFAYPREPAPKLPDGKNWTFWQYAFHGTKEQFSSWTRTGGDSVGSLAAPVQ